MSQYMCAVIAIEIMFIFMGEMVAKGLSLLTDSASHIVWSAVLY